MTIAARLRSAALPALLLAVLAGCVMSPTVPGFIARGLVTTVIPHWLGF